MTQVGQTISGEEFNKTYSVGTTLSADEFSNYGGSSVEKTASETPKNGTKFDWLAPVLGTVGSLGGMGVQGGQIGEAANQLLSGKPFSDPNKIAGAGVEQGLYSLIPGGKLGGGIVKNALTRLIGGGAVGAGTQVVRNVENEQPITKDLGSQAIMTGGINAVLPGLTSIISKPMGYAGKVVPRDIEKVLVEEPIKKATQLFRAVQEKMVGFKNVEYAVNNGIIKNNEALTPGHVQQAIDATKNLLTQKEEQLQQILQQENIQVPYKDIIPKLKEIIANSPPTKNVPKLQAFSGWLENQVLSDASLAGKANNPAAIEDIMNGKYPISLSTINQIKRTLGQYYDESPLHRQLYKTIRNYIEDASGVPLDVKTINKEMGQLIDVKDNLSQNAGVVAKQYTPEAIDEMIKKEMEKNPKSLHTFIASLSTLLSLGGGALAGIPGLAGGAAAGTLGYFRLMQVLSSPGAKQALQQGLEKTAGRAYDAGSNLQVNKILEQIGVRVPGLTNE